MHACPERSAGIYGSLDFIAVFFLYLFPGRDDENIIDVELVEILLPVVDPVHPPSGIPRSCTLYIQISAHLIQFLPYVQKDLPLSSSSSR